MNVFKISFALVICTVFATVMRGQLIITDPPFPETGQPVTVIFDAALGSGGLAGYDGTVYAHTGVITEFSTSGTDWKYVMSDWGQNTPETRMTRIGADLYSLEIIPDIRNYYGVPADEEILQMAFVFRSATQVGGQWLEGKTAEGGDIFVDVYEPGLNVAFQQPEAVPVILIPGDNIIVVANASEADSLALYLDDVLLKKVAGNFLEDTITASGYGNSWVKAVATLEDQMAADSFYFHVRKPVEIRERPASMKDGINYQGPSSAALSLVAPGKEYIFVTGDFNEWMIDSSYYMYQTPDGERFWLEINGLIPGEPYVFQYFIDGEIRVGDPYAEQVSDPWNDRFIPDTTYPGLVEYPDGKTSGIATVLQTGQQPYPWEVEDFQPPAVTDLVIYELLVRDFTSEHTYAAVVERLDYLADLGVNAVELMPVNEFEGNISWGYNPSYYFAPDKYYGPKNELKRLIDECHKRGMAVLVDMVQMYFDGDKPTPGNPWFNVNSNFTNPDAQWGNDFDHESLYTQQLVDSINSYWMSEYKVDGFRFDFTKGFGNNIKTSSDPWGSNYDADRIRLLKRMADEIWERNDDAIIIFEHLAENLEEKELADYGILMWGNLNGPYSEAAMGYHDNGKSNIKTISYKIRGWDHPHLVGYMESHDEERMMYKCITYGDSAGNYKVRDTITALNRMALSAVFFLTVPGPKMIWQFGEMGYDVSIDYNGRTGPKPVRWEYLEERPRKFLSGFYGALAKLRVEQDVFRTDDFNITGTMEMKRIELNHESMNVIVIGNFGLVPGQVNPAFQHTGTWYDYFTGESMEVADPDQPFTLQAGEFRLFIDKYLPPPDISYSLEEPEVPVHGMTIRAYPNPFEGDFTINIHSDRTTETSVLMYDPAGRILGNFHLKLSEGNNAFGSSELYHPAGELPPGIYLITVSSSRTILGTVRIVKH